jgi:hypothetical protein
MPNSTAAVSGRPRLRVVFDDAVMSFALSEQPSLADIALLLTERATGNHGAPLAIDIAWLDDSSAGSQRAFPMHA